MSVSGGSPPKSKPSPRHRSALFEHDDQAPISLVAEVHQDKHYALAVRQGGRTLRIFLLSYISSVCVILLSLLKLGNYTASNDVMSTYEPFQTSEKPFCTHVISEKNYYVDGTVDEIKLQKVREGEAMVAYIVERMNQIAAAPVSIMFGTLLHEYRNGTAGSPCVSYDATDKDLDIALFEAHFHVVVDMRFELESLFGWEVAFLERSRMIMILKPRGQTKKSRARFQLDIYGFQTNQKMGLVYFPWDMITFAINGLLPLVKYKTMAYNGTRKKDLFLHAPFNVTCLLSNLFGSNFMTPDKSANYFFERNAYGNPVCERRNMTSYEEAELERQLHFSTRIY